MFIEKAFLFEKLFKLEQHNSIEQYIVKVGP